MTGGGASMCVGGVVGGRVIGRSGHSALAEPTIAVCSIAAVRRASGTLRLGAVAVFILGGPLELIPEVHGDSGGELRKRLQLLNLVQQGFACDLIGTWQLCTG